MLLRTTTTVPAHQQLGCDPDEAQPSPFPSQMCHLTPCPIPLGTLTLPSWRLQPGER